MRRTRRIIVVLLLLLALNSAGPVAAPPAGAAFPGGNGVIVFASSRPKAPPFSPQHIYAINPDGTGVTRLTDRELYDWSPDVSADGFRIVFTRRRETYPFSPGQLWVVNIDGTGEQKIARISKAEPAWSPDGEWIAYREGNSVFANVWIMRADGTEKTPLTSEFGFDGEPAWSPDGTKIAFVHEAYPEDVYEIWVMDADGSNPTQLTDTGGVYGGLDWSPDGSKIAFHVQNGGVHLGYVPAAGGAEVLIETGRSAFDPSWSPDGTQLAFSRRKNAGYDIYTVYLDGTGLTRVTRRQALDFDPDWQPLPVP